MTVYNMLHTNKRVSKLQYNLTSGLNSLSWIVKIVLLCTIKELRPTKKCPMTVTQNNPNRNSKAEN